ncbi:MAG: NADH-quinone oxidoreductase subunit 5 family protein [Candidatus Heimdallarchaeaceae archaeon]
METIFILVTIAVLSPIIGAFVSLLLKKWHTIRDIFSVLTITVSAISAVITFILYDGNPVSFPIKWLSWSAGPNISSTTTQVVASGFFLDPLSILMAMIVSILSMLIAFFSLEYMSEDKHHARYWFFIQLFVGGMLLLVLAQDMVFLFLGWEMVGLCSCFLIAHHFSKKGEEGRKAALSGIKALIMTGIGDVGLLAFLAWTYSTTGSIIIDVEHTLNGNYGILMSILLLLAPVTKSAQFPLQSWLSSGDTVDIDAMQGPTTVSALIHAATMVKAGVYLVARFSPIWNVDFFYYVLMIIAGISVIAAALGALVTTDIKRVLAYSTISQLSYMFLAFTIRKGYEEAGLFAGQMHLFSHSIFKALLFLSAGAIIHSIAEERDMRNMGGLKKELPWVYGFMLMGILGLMGIPIIANGGYSKELIISTSYEAAIHGYPVYWFVFIVGVLTAILTALYATRMFLMIFHGKNRGATIHKPKYIMRITLGILAVLVFATGFIIEGPLRNFMEEKTDTYALIRDFQVVPFVCAIGAIILGIGLAWLFYGKGQTEVSFVEKNKILRDLRTYVANGYYIDHFYNAVFVKPVFWIGKQLSFLKTGKINWNMILGSVVTVVTLVVLVVVMV